MSYFAPTYFGKSYFAGMYFPPLEDALAGVALLTNQTGGYGSPMGWRWQEWQPTETTILNDDEAIVIALLIAS